MMLNAVVALAVAILVLFGPLLVFAYAVIVFGADSRSGINERDRRTWLWRGPFR